MLTRKTKHGQRHPGRLDSSVAHLRQYAERDARLADLDRDPVG